VFGVRERAGRRSVLCPAVPLACFPTNSSHNSSRGAAMKVRKDHFADVSSGGASGAFEPLSSDRPSGKVTRRAFMKREPSRAR
jgi:hypothetical protein